MPKSLYETIEAPMSDFDVIEDTFAGSTIRFDFFKTFVGSQIGAGIARCVYECNIDSKMVIKIESTSQSFHNVEEWNVWEAVQKTKFAKWFAPCVYISSCGTVLLQKKTSPVLNWPKKIPDFFTDCKMDNYGMYRKHFVCHDYGLNMLKERGISKKMRKVKWLDF